MALIDLLNNDPKFFYYSGQGNFTQKSISYGDSSQTPLVQFPLPENASADTKNYYELNRTGNDYPLRGGNSLNISLTGPTVPQAAEIDRKRIQSFLKTSKGNIFLIKQKELQFANPKIEAGEAAQPFNQQVGRLAQGGIEYTRIYNNGLNTLKQVEVQGSGFHYDRHGNVPVNPYQLSYFYTVKNKNQDLNRLVFLLRSKIQQDPFLNFNNFSNLGVSTSNNLLFEYQGGPDSIGGRGFTTIERTVYTDQSDIDITKGDVNRGVNVLSYAQISELGTENVRGKIKADFRSILPNIASSNYDQNSIENRLRVGSPGSVDRPRIDYLDTTSIGTDLGVDIVNAGKWRNTFSGEDPWQQAFADLGVSYEDVDIIKFGFEAINYDDPTTSTFVQFRAFLNSFSDNHAAAYNEVKYVGRGETFYAYDGFTRKISFGFLVAAQSRQELLPLYDKLNIFVSQIYPDYGVNSFMRTPVIRMTIGDYIYRQPGFLNSANISIETDYPWEIKLEKGDSTVAQLPQVLKVDCEFTPLHNFLPEKSKKDRPTPLINQYDKKEISNASSIGITQDNTFNTTATLTPVILNTPISPLAQTAVTSTILTQTSTQTATVQTRTNSTRRQSTVNAQASTGRTSGNSRQQQITAVQDKTKVVAKYNKAQQNVASTPDPGYIRAKLTGK